VAASNGALDVVLRLVAGGAVWRGSRAVPDADVVKLLVRKGSYKVGVWCMALPDRVERTIPRQPGLFLSLCVLTHAQPTKRTHQTHPPNHRQTPTGELS
jgi:hypothetical protein